MWASTEQVIDIGQAVIGYVYVFVAISIVVLFLARNVPGIIPKSILLIILLLAIGTPALLSFGFYSAALFWFVSVCLAASFVFKKAWVYSLVSLVGIFIILAALEERVRLGRDLHNGLGQVTGYLNVQAQAVLTLLNQGHQEAAQHNLTDLSQVA